jgi:hypothetical protein
MITPSGSVNCHYAHRGNAVGSRKLAFVLCVSVTSVTKLAPLS